MTVRFVWKYCKSEKNTTVISSERNSNNSGQIQQNYFPVNIYGIVKKC